MSNDSFETLDALVAAFPARNCTEAIVEFTAESAHSVSYDELYKRITTVAEHLASKGIGRGDWVLVCGHNSINWICAYLGAVRAGAGAIPLDEDASAVFIAAVLRHSQPRYAFFSGTRIEELEGQCDGVDLPDHGVLDTLQLEPAGGSAATVLPALNTEPERIASLIYTSGTTGTPKAVPLTHRNLMANANALMAAGLIGPTERVLLPLPLHHSYPFTVGLLLVLGMGGTIVMPSGVSGPELTGALKQGKVSAMIGVPSLYEAVWGGIEARIQAEGKRVSYLFGRMLWLSRHTQRLTGIRLGRLLFRRLHKLFGGNLRILGCGGAKLDAGLAGKLEALGWTVLSGYGLTETSPVLTFNSGRSRRIDTEGRPIPGVEVSVTPSATEANGEILARGPNVFGGYWNNPEATQAAFTHDGWFRTGDLGWVDDTGYLHVAGRLKEVIVLADGKNIFPEDVEPAYLASPLLDEVALLESDGGLVALVVPDEQELRKQGGLGAVRLIGEALEKSGMGLPRYQRISNFRVVRKALPRTRLGKLRRHLLADIYTAADQRSIDEPPEAISEADQQLIDTSDTTRHVWGWLQQHFPDRHLSLDMSPQLDLQVDSVGWVSLTLELEQRCGVSLPGSVVSRIVTLRDLLIQADQVGQNPAAAPDSGKAHTAPPQPGVLASLLGRVLLGLCRWIMRSLFRLRVNGRDYVEGDRSLVLAPNHVSYLDPAAIASALSHDRLSNTFWAGWVGIMHAGPVSRLVSRATRVFAVDPDQDIAGAIGTGRAILENGGSLVWFPEGRRSPDGEMRPFRQGIGLLLDGQSSLVVPTWIAGTYTAWPASKRLPNARGRVSVTFGEPVSIEALAAEGAGDSSAARVQSALEKRVAELGAAAESRD